MLLTPVYISALASKGENKMRAKAKVDRIFSKLYGEDVRLVPKYEILIECGLWPRPIDRDLLIGRENGKSVIEYLLTDQDFYEKLPEGTKWENVWGFVAPDGTYKGRCKRCGFTMLFNYGHDSQYNYCPQCGLRKFGSNLED